MAQLGYDQVRNAQDPRMTLLGFLQNADDAGVRTAGWDGQELTSSFCPPQQNSSLESGYAGLWPVGSVAAAAGVVATSEV
jgi:Family of unknown function (DUF5996)